MKTFKNYCNIIIESTENDIEVLKELLKEQIEKFDIGMSSDAKKGKKIVNNLQDGIYELISDLTDSDELSNYAYDSKGLSADDVSMEDDDEEFEAMIQSWEDVYYNSKEVAAYNDYLINNNRNAKIVKTLQGCLKRL